MKHFIFLWKFLDNKEKAYFFYIIFLMIIQAVLEILSIALIIPFTALILDPSQKTNLLFFDNFHFIFDNYNRDSLLPIYATLFFFIFVIKNFTLIFIYNVFYNYSKIIRASLSTKLLSKYLKQDYGYFVKTSFSKIQANLLNEVTTLLHNFFIPIQVILSEGIILISIMVLLFITNNFQGALIVVPTFIIVGFIVKLLNQKIKVLGEERVTTNRDNAKLTHYILLGVRDILLMGKTKKVLNYFTKLQLKIGEIDAKFQIIRLLPKNLIEIFGLLSFLLLVIFLFNQGSQNNEIITTLTFYFFVAYRILPSINKIFTHYQMVKFSKNSVLIIGNDLSLKDKIYLSVNENLRIDFKKDIILKNVSFNYQDNQKILDCIDIEITKGEIIGIQGESGSGKTTLLNIISRLSEPTEGKIILDGKSLESKKEIRAYQNLISLISQDTFLIEGSIKENILLGTDGYDEQRFKNSLELSLVNDFLLSLPEGLNTLVGTNSKMISSGQKQRIAIARQFYSDKELFILDEATNAIDEKNENNILENIKNFKSNKTIIIVSHNSKNLRVCDKIYYFNNGKLLKKN